MSFIVFPLQQTARKLEPQFGILHLPCWHKNFMHFKFWPNFVESQQLVIFVYPPPPKKKKKTKKKKLSSNEK